MNAVIAPNRIAQIALSVHDMDRAIRFWRDLVGLRFLFQAPNVAFFDVGGIRFMLGQAEPPDLKQAGTVIYFNVEDIQAAFAALRDNGVVVVGEPHFIAPLGTRDLWMAFLSDPDGNTFALSSEIERPG